MASLRPFLGVVGKFGAGNVVISGIHALSETESVLVNHVKLIACSADDAQRYAMAKSRNRLHDSTCDRERLYRAIL